MKIIVLSDGGGNIESVAVPDRKLAVDLELVAKGRVHALDVNSRVLNREALLEPENREAQKKAYKRLRSLIESAEAKGCTSRGSKPASTGRKRR